METVWVSTVVHGCGSNFYASTTREGVIRQVANYCRYWWEDAVSRRKPPADDEEAIAEYFEAMAGEEWCNVDLVPITDGV